MTTRTRNTGRYFRFAGKAIFAVLALCLLTNTACPQVESTRPNYDVSPRRVSLIQPGTVIEKGPPQEWSHLIIKSHPRAGAGDVNQLTASANQYTSFLFTAIIANVQPEKIGNQTRYRLTGLAAGLGTKVNGKDMILSPDKQQALGANLPLVARVVLSKAQDKLGEMQKIARSDSMVLFDASGLLERSGKHIHVSLRYALLIDEKTGSLDTLLWAVERDERGVNRAAITSIEWLPPNKLDDCVLHVDGNEIRLRVPSENAFAMVRIPQGQKQIAMPHDVKALAGRTRLTADMAYQLETRLRELMK